MQFLSTQKTKNANTTDIIIIKKEQKFEKCGGKIPKISFGMSELSK